MKKVILLFLSILGTMIGYCQQPGIGFICTDTRLQNAFDWAKKMALHYKGNPGDASGPWYESALPPRFAFCMRDVSHQSIGGEILGLSEENKNMFSLFAKNISKGKDWCTYWEINRTGNPAPEDYRNDTAFWYNLNANFDVLTVCWKLYLWTGDTTFINAPAFASFHQLTTDQYIKTWVLEPDSLLTRPAHPNASASFNEADAFHRCRGLPSYSEGVPNMKTGVDLIAAIYRGLLSYAAILQLNGNENEAAYFARQANGYQQHIDALWWDESAGLYNTYYGNDGKFGKNEGETFLLWFDALKDSSRIHKTIAHLLAGDWNVENLSYHALLYYKNGYWDKAYDNILHLSNPSTKRREYPEVSFGVIEGIVQGLMGIDADARFNRVSTVLRSRSGINAELKHVPLLKTYITVRHTGNKKSELVNEGRRVINWRVGFAGSYEKIFAQGKAVKATVQTDIAGNIYSFADVPVGPGKTMIASVRTLSDKKGN